MQPIITENRERIAELCRQHHVRTLAVFGSAVRDDFDPTRSDVDLLVEFEPLPYPESVENYWEFEDALKELFARKVDLIRNGLIKNPYLLREIQAEQEMLYAA
jgi:predicted nucleotidyltransferase